MPDPTPADPPVILRNRLAAGLEAMGIFDIDTIARVVMDGDVIMVVRYVPGAAVHELSTETTRIEIR